MPNESGTRLSGLIAILGVLTLVVGLVVMILLPATRLAAWGCLALGVLLLGAAFIIDFQQVSHALTGRRGKFGTGATVMASIFIGITVLVNAISIGSYQRFDVTGLSQFTITSQTKDVLGKLTTPVEAICFFVPGDQYGISTYVTSLLDEYKNYTDKLSIKTIDPDEHPDQARAYGITQYQTVVFESQDHRRMVPPTDIMVTTTDQQGNQQLIGLEAENAFTSAILEVTGTVQKKLYFLTGHGESSPDSGAANGYSDAKQGLLDNLYRVDTLDLLATPGIPEDCTALIIAAPRQAPSSNELKIIDSYIKGGGWVLFLLNPDSPTEFKQLLLPWEIKVEDGIVIDPSSYTTPSIDSPLVPRNRDFFALADIYFPGATAISPQENGILPKQPLAWTSPESWLESNFTAGQEPRFNDGTDLKGPLAIAVLVAGLPTEQAPSAPAAGINLTRLVIIGDSDFASNQHFYNGGNGDFFLNSVQILTTGKELISIERKVLPFRRLVTTPDVEKFINYSSIALLPLLVLIAGGIVWWQRR